uniref:Uncharacterized protein n=1 Tax=Arundo donax TaxID=35708 RepID=A0A0A9F6E7_ARUDO
MGGSIVLNRQALICPRLVRSLTSFQRPVTHQGQVHGANSPCRRRRRR